MEIKNMNTLSANISKANDENREVEGKHKNEAEAVKNEGNESAKEDNKAIKVSVSSNGENDYVAISRDGDTLELSSLSVESKDASGKSKVFDNTPNMTDAELTKCSKARLKQLLSAGKISRKQYEKAMKQATN